MSAPKITIPNAYWIRKEGMPYHIGFRYSPSFEDEVQGLINLANARIIGQLSLTIGLPFRPRTTGPRSQNNGLWGWCDCLALQLSSRGKQYTREQVKAAMCRMAVGELSYPTVIGADGAEEPKPTEFASVEEMNLVLRTIQMYADQNNFWLIEYDNRGKPYKSVGGRSPAEMEKYWARSLEGVTP